MLYGILWNLCCVSRVCMSAVVSVEKRGARLTEALSRLNLFSQRLCAFRFFHHSKPTLSWSSSTDSRSLNSAAPKQCTCKPIFCGFVRSCTKCHFKFLWIPGAIWPVGTPSSVPFNLADWRQATFSNWPAAHVLIFPVRRSPGPKFPIAILCKSYF